MPRSASMRTALLALCIAMAQAIAFAGPGDTVTGPVTDTLNTGVGYITCLGTPACTGAITVDGIQEPGCPNTGSFTTGASFTGLDLSHSGALSGTFTIAQVVDGHTTNGNGTCNYTLVAGNTSSFTGTWNATLGTGKVDIAFVEPDGGAANTLHFAFSANVAGSPPVFPMTVDGSVTPSTTDMDATIKPRPQDTGTSTSVYVFVHAPSNLVHGASPKRDPGTSVAASTKDDAIVCVLAQVGPNNQLTAVSASTMQAYLTGVISSQGQAVQLLNNVPTPNVAGAAVFVGYGSSAAAMLSSGVYQSALSVPGPVQCTASLAAAPAPKSPGALTGLWWNANESGWGIHFTQRASNIFAAWYTYDGAGKPKWYVAPNCVGASATNGTCTSKIYEVNGPTFFGATFDPKLVNVVEAGTLSVTFQDANNGSMTYTVASQTRTVAITRQPLGSGASAVIDYSDLWWNPNESGWGMAMAQQASNVFLAWYVYDGTGKPVWYVASNCTLNGSSCSGPLYSTTGPPFGPTFSGTIGVTNVGSVIVSFVDANNAVLSYTVNGVSATKAITRQIF
jgi:hypothetical protein